MRKQFKKIVILSFFFILISSFGSNAFIQRQQTENYLFGLQIVNWPGTGYTETPDTLNSIVPICARKHYTTQVLIRYAILDWTYFRNYFSQGLNCFPQNEYESIIAIREERDGFFSVNFFIRGHDFTGGGNTQYGLHLYEGQIVDGTEHDVPCDPGNEIRRWPPQKEGMITVVEFNKWEIIVEGYRAPKKKQGKKCVGMGEFTIPVEFWVTNKGPST